MYTVQHTPKTDYATTITRLCMIHNVDVMANELSDDFNNAFYVFIHNVITLKTNNEKITTILALISVLELSLVGTSVLGEWPRIPHTGCGVLVTINI